MDGQVKSISLEQFTCSHKFDAIEQVEMSKESYAVESDKSFHNVD